MGRAALQKTVADHHGFGEAIPIDYKNHIDLTLRGVVIPKTNPARVMVPIFEHSYYPKKSATEHEIRQNIAKRAVTVPSLQMLREHGIEADKAVFVFQVSVHPRNIRNHNYFRGDFPAVVKGIAKRENVVFIFPASDMPSARWKRKKVLAFYRASFAPLFIKGRHYTSGRMSFFMAGPPGAFKKLSRSMNMEGKDETVRDSLTEWYPTMNKTRAPRKRGPKPKFNRHQQRTAEDVVKDTSLRLQTDLMPVMLDKMDVSQHSPEAKELETWLGKPAVSRDLLRRTKGRNRLAAAKTWVNQVLIPQAKEIVRDESAAMADTISRWVVRQMLTSIVAMVVDSVKETKLGQSQGFAGRTLRRVEFNPDVHAVQVGSGIARYTPPMAEKNKEQKRRVYEHLKDLYIQKTGDTRADIEHFLTVTISPKASTAISVTVNRDVLAKSVKYTPRAVGDFSDEGKLNAGYYKHFKMHILPQMVTEVNRWYEAGMASSYNQGDIW